MSTWLGLVAPASEQPAVLAEETAVLNVGQGDTLNLTLTGAPNTQLKLDLVDGEPLVSAEMTFTPRVLPTQSGFVWDEAADWNHPDAISNGSSVSPTNGALTGSSPGILWDFNTNNPGWTFSNSYTGRITTPACGFNGTTGGALRTYAGSTYGTSPVVNLAGEPVPFHAGARRSVGLRETPDAGENLQFQYKTSTGSWTMFTPLTQRALAEHQKPTFST